MQSSYSKSITTKIQQGLHNLATTLQYAWNTQITPAVAVGDVLLALWKGGV